MPFEPVGGDARASGGLDFLRRADLSEWMDEPCSFEEFRACLRSLERSNRLTFTYRPTLAWLQQFGSVARPLHVVDVGFGGGDMLRRIEQWAKRRGLDWSLTGIDLNPHAARAAKEFTPVESRIRWVTGHAYCYEPDRPIDLILNSLLMHHLPEDEIPRFLGWMEARAGMGWFVNDLHRQPVPYHFYWWFARAMRFHPFVRHDGPVSIRRAFRAEDWERYSRAASLPARAAEVRTVWPARLCVSRVKRIA